MALWLALVMGYWSKLTPLRPGMTVSTTNAKAGDAALALPATSLTVAVMLWLPSVRLAPGVNCQLPLPSLLTVPNAPSTDDIRLTSLLASVVPLNCGVAILVMLSLFEAPLSLALAKSTWPGAAGAVVSIVTANAADAVDSLPAVSLALTLRLWLPSLKLLLVIVQLPPPSAVALPSTVVPSVS